MTLTRRGWIVAALAVALILLARANGARSINAVVAPVLVALAGSVLQAHLRDRPDVERRAPAAGVVGDAVTVELSIPADRPFVATVDDRLGDGLTAEGVPTATIIDGAPVRYDVRLRERGERRVGPAELAVEGLFGLARRTFYYDDIDAVLAYPRTYRLDPSADALEGLPTDRPFPGTDQFDGLREYQRGDSRRAIHWKSSAKRPDDELLVRQYVGNATRGALTVGVSPGDLDDAEARSASSPRSARPHDDAVAEAAASLSLYLLDAGFEVGLVTPDERLDPGAGRHQREAVLAALARLKPGTLSDARAADADLFVRAPAGDVVVTDGEDAVPFDRLVATERGERVRYERPVEGARNGATPVENGGRDGDGEVIA